MRFQGPECAYMRIVWMLCGWAPVLAATNTWTLKNSALTAEAVFTPEKGIAVTSLVSRSGRQFANPASPSLLFRGRIRYERQAQPPNGANPPPIYKVEERREYDLDGAGPWTLLGAGVNSRDGTTLTLKLLKDALPVEIVLYMRCRPDASPAR